MARSIVPPGEGRSFDVARGRRIRITTPQGYQAADFFAYNAESVAEWLSPPHTWIATRSIVPRPGDVFLSRFRRPMLRLSADGAEGIHDMLLAACDQFRYESFGHRGPHANCSDNLMTAMRRIGREISVIPQPVNFFTNTKVEPDGRLLAPRSIVKPGAWVELEALIDTICVVSACPFDVTPPDWEINAGGKLTELEVEVR
ncbi:MAG TPA: urea carboxylase-associated family protein [Candidatus Binatia bacterium]|jgi:hypothetical protein|nr:urea carboxylase-associated family protein [Candidatus Binatia bacterium]